ncbi:hypothetical protein P170DRAFT_397611 [Aspergillus steynii IBT 23096]|uniref:Stress-associated endoplasmic reticulum protein n=1 Tax=Aspergillus steynii IBT 23096 TaxID=1392250 RepID=A0A2I2GN78_9EURO|nr:uncharacterized protein P170DRAFT_397611 [Aspergillus steynii IBT 23096]PLB54309.1 hypothetical protein P170DRAFT_397611 [Aspergillus steynii IBT 23096]
MAQTPQQRKANEKYAKSEAAKRGRGITTPRQKQSSKSPVSVGWVVLLAFVICGGLAFELLRIVPEIWSSAVSMFNRLAF